MEKNIGDTMEINILKIKEELTKIDNLYEDYEKIYINLYNEFKKIQSVWISQKSNEFNNYILSEKQKVKQTIDDMKNVNNIYDYLVENYKILGDKIKFNINNKDKVIDKINNYQDKLVKIINKYNNINYKEYTEEEKMIIFQKKILLNNKENLENIKKQILDKLKKIEEIEKEVSLRISKIDIEIIKESDITNLV